MTLPHDPDLAQQLAEARTIIRRLKASEERFRALVENGHDGVALLQQDDTVRYVSPSIRTILGYGPEELEGRIGFEFVHPQDRPRAHLLVEAARQSGGAPVREELRAIHKDGGWRFVEVVVADRLQDPDVTALVCNFRDVTERHAAEEELRESRAMLERAQAAAHVGSWAADAAPGAGLRWSKEARRIFGIGDEEAGSLQTFLSRVHPDDLERVQAAGEATLRDGVPTAVDYRIRMVEGGAVKWIRQHAEVTRDASGTPWQVVGVVQDITERRRLEEQFFQAQKMEAVGRLAGGIAHDFNNLLSVILGFADLATRHLGDPVQLRDRLGQIRLAAEKAAALTRQLLAFSRRQVLEPRVLSLDSVVRDMEKMLRRVLGEEIELRTSTAGRLGHVKVDPGQLEQVVLNLAVNARDAMPRGGILTIETRNVHLKEGSSTGEAVARAGRYVLLAVADTGEGMDRETRSRMFEPFFTTKDHGKGTGLGLATVYGIVAQSGGHVWADSEPGRGTTVKVYFPLIEEAPDAPRRPAGPEAPAPRGSETILLVEDEDGVREITAEVLGDLGYSVRSFASGRAALDAVSRGPVPFELVVTDVVMPGMGGQELWERLQALHPAARVLFMSGYADEAIGRDGVLPPQTNFLQKPFPLDVLAGKVREILDAPRGEGPAPGAASP